MTDDSRPDVATEAFVAHRNLLFTVAYEMLGSAADAEDVIACRRGPRHRAVLDAQPESSRVYSAKPW